MSRAAANVRIHPGLLVAACALWACPGSAQQIVLSTYVGGPKADALTGAAVRPDGSVVVGGYTGATRSTDKGEKLEGGQGLIQIIGRDGEGQAHTTLPIRVSDLDSNDEADVYVTGPGGSMKLGACLQVYWRSEVGGEGARICAGPEHGAVVLAQKRIYVLTAAGKVAGEFPVSGGYVEDVACDVKRGLIFVCGFDNKRGTPPRQRNYPVQVAFVRAYDPSGKQVWAAYGWKGQDVADLELMADTRGYRLALGRDGKLYLGGESAGGNTIWMRSSLDLKKTVNQVKGDQFQHAYNTSANHVSAVVRLDPKTGESEMATLLLARIASKGNKGNTLRMRAIAADEQGNVYVGGPSAFSPPKSPGSFGREGGGAYLVAFDKNFRRTYATTLARDGATNAVAVGHGSLVAVGECKTELATYHPLKAAGDAEGDGFATLFRLPGQ